MMQMMHNKFGWMITFASFSLKYLGCFVKYTEYSSQLRLLVWWLWKRLKVQQGANCNINYEFNLH